MAETIINLVLVKLAEEVVREALFLGGVRDKVERVQRDLKWIQSFLKDADTKYHKDERVKQWVNEVQEVGYLIEDLLDKFLVEIGGGRREGLRNKLKRIGKMPMKLITKHKAGNEIDQIQQRLCEIKENATMYGIEGQKETSTGALVEQPIRPFVNLDIDETEVVGLEVGKKTIVDQLIATNITRRAVMSIVGADGSGKTTLANEVYKSTEVKHHFDISVWLTISQEYKLIDILKKMLEKIKRLIDSERQITEEEFFITKLINSMKERKYLIVLDGVSSSNVWTQLEVALPNDGNGSRVLIITRFIKIAEEIDRISKPYVIQPLNEEESKQLLLKKVFPNQFANECPIDLLSLATQFTKKCHGWPLPLVVLGGILSRKKPDYVTWDEVMQNMDWRTDGSNFMGVISTSYEDLLAALKPCFMYFGVFPEDYQIKATTLIQLWIAEGFIRQEGSKSLEDIAESYLKELVQRCMVQVSRRSFIGKIYCHIHDLLLGLAIKKAKEDNFLTVVTKNDNKLSCSTCARRVSLHGYGDKVIEHACSKNLRSLINFEDVPNFNRFGMLRVLHMSTVSNRYLYGTNCLKGLNALTSLKYFRLEGEFHLYCDLPTFKFFKRSALTYMKNLQTVDALTCAFHYELPLSFWDNKQLRHIKISHCDIHPIPPEGPPSTADLQSLLTLKGVRARQDWVVELPNFPYLRKLGIYIYEDVAQTVINLLSNLKLLGSLYFNVGGDRQMIFSYCISAFRNHNRLHSFSLVKGRWPKKEVDCTMFPPNLVKLKLYSIDFEEDPMPQLEKLPNLRVLELGNSSIQTADDDEEQMIMCSRGGFSRLQRLVLLFIDDLDEWKIEEGAMPMLNQLDLACFSLQTIPDLQYLANLQEFTALCLNRFKSRLQGEDQWKIKHIPSVKLL